MAAVVAGVGRIVPQCHREVLMANGRRRRKSRKSRRRRRCGVDVHKFFITKQRFVYCFRAKNVAT